MDALKGEGGTAPLIPHRRPCSEEDILVCLFRTIYDGGYVSQIDWTAPVDSHHDTAHINGIGQETTRVDQDFTAFGGETSNLGFLIGSPEHVNNSTGIKVKTCHANCVQEDLYLPSVTADHGCG